MARIWNPSIRVRTSHSINSNGAGTPLKPHTSSLPQYHSKAGYGARRGGRKVFVAMSGGVDSSVSAALLKQQGYRVVGAFIKGWDLPRLGSESRRGHFHCTWRDERRDAMRVAATLDIPLVTVDLSSEYKQLVVDYLIHEYKAGRTPNPDVMCNKEIKFGLFFDWARKRGADYVATGHYAQTHWQKTFPAHGQQGKFATKSFCQLGVSRDTNKDQTYFLWTLTPEHLAHTLFPVGNYLKSEVRQLAKKFKLPTAEKNDSQGICVLGQVDMWEFLETYLPKKSGSVINKSGQTIGEHHGVQFYTLGQRHGFTVTTSGARSRPQYVVAKSLAKNILTVAPQAKSVANTVQLEQINWISNQEPSEIKNYQARIRHRGELLSCRIKMINADQLEITFSNPAPLIAPGQSVVVYDHKVCLGGGVVV